jgi:hypothetical protein
LPQRGGALGQFGLRGDHLALACAGERSGLGCPSLSGVDLTAVLRLMTAVCRAYLPAGAVSCAARRMPGRPVPERDLGLRWIAALCGAAIALIPEVHVVVDWICSESTVNRASPSRGSSREHLACELLTLGDTLSTVIIDDRSQVACEDAAASADIWSDRTGTAARR